MATKHSLKKYHKRAIELKYKGNSYKDIAEILSGEFNKSGVKQNFSEQTIKDWFRQAGTLAEAYRLYEEEWDNINGDLSIAAKKAGVQILESNFRTTCEMLIALLGSETDAVKLGAIKEILDRVLGKARQPVDLMGKVGLDLSKYENRLKAIREDDNE